MVNYCIADLISSKKVRKEKEKKTQHNIDEITLRKIFERSLPTGMKKTQVHGID